MEGGMQVADACLEGGVRRWGFTWRASRRLGNTAATRLQSGSGHEESWELKAFLGHEHQHGMGIYSVLP